MPDTKEPAANTPVEPGAASTPPAAATPPSSEPAVTPDKVDVPQGYRLMKEEDVNKLISQRDKANNGSSEDTALLNALLQKDAIRDAVNSDDFKEKYPDVTADDLLNASPTSDDEIIEVAKKTQARFEKIKQDHIAKVQSNTSAPTISPEDRDNQLKELKGANKPANAFQKGLQLMRAKVQ